LPPPKDKVNAYIVYYLQVTRFVDTRFPSVIFRETFGSEVVTTEDPPTTPRFDRLRKESAALSALSAESPSVLTRCKEAAAISAAPPPAEPSIAELDSQSFDLDDIGPPSPPRIPAFRNGRKTFISRHEAANEDDDNESDDQDKSTTEGRPSKRSKSNQEENKSDNKSIEGDDVGGDDNVAEGDGVPSICFVNHSDTSQTEIPWWEGAL
jgi:hypothetical protein